jgi:hypothetical protein
VPESPDLDELLATLRARVEERRRDAEYPPGLEDDLDKHYRHIVGAHRPPSTASLLDELDGVRAELNNFAFRSDDISVESRIPGGATVHRAVAKTTSRQIQGVLEQAQRHANLVSRTITLMAAVSDSIADTYDRSVMQQLDDLQLRLAEHERELHRTLVRLDDVIAAAPGAPVEPWYSSAAFEERFGRDVAGAHEQDAELAAQFVGCAPVLDLAIGGGEFLELLRACDVDGRGVDIDVGSVESARNRGLSAEVGEPYEALRAVDDGTLGGIVMRNVIEFLPPQHAIDIVRLAAEKLRRGGKVLVDTVNPASLVTHARTLGIGARTVRPLHPSYLAFLFGEAGFAEIVHIDRAPVADDESLELIPGEDETAKRLNANFERINALLFAPQGYAIVATR